MTSRTQILSPLPGSAALVRPLLRELWLLTKPRITLMVLLTTAVGMLLAGATEIATVLAALAGTFLLASGASAANMVAEREVDSRMERTRDRPLPAGRLALGPALGFAVAISSIGLAVLALGANPLTGVLGAATWLIYVFVYTPMKRLSPWSTVIGAVPGALPPVMGYAAGANALGAWAGVLFALLFFWQLPHFFAIAWMYRADYARGALKMLPVVDPSGRRIARQTLLFTTALLVAGVAPLALGLSSAFYGVVATGLGGLFLYHAARFSRRLDQASARGLLLYSVLYLPAILTAMVADHLI